MALHRPNLRRLAGFTLIELMVALAVAAVLTAVALPSFNDLLRGNRVSSTSNNLLTAINLARSEAIKTNRGGGVCASTDGSTCSTVATAWTSGWIVWADLDNSGALNLVPVDERIRIEGAQRQVTVTATAAAMRFNARGRPTAAFDLAVRSVVCPTGQTYARDVNLLASGMVRIARTTCP
ncbi:MAG: pre-pilin like leader sequence [Lysobacteraceae bacterium]|nr:MAG: pre-pilin like leader sequence [Xanthomonadaceae bacterium]